MDSSLPTLITRRTLLAALGTSAIGLAMGLPLYADDAKSEALAKLLPGFAEPSRDVLRRLLKDPNYSGSIPAADAARLAQNEKVTIDQLMVALLPLAQSYSQAPISNFYVGVVVRGASGNLYTGANIEIPGQCLGFAVHAEQSALSNAYMHSETAVEALAVGGAPCGHCRQFIEEVSPDGEILILTPDKAPTKLAAILPAAFGPLALKRNGGAFPVVETGLSLVQASLVQTSLVQTSDDELTKAALVAARRSYAPYSQSPAGVAIRSAGGRIYRGSYIENVAFNPSLSPLQVALAAMIAAGERYSAISAVTLVEVEGAKISQKDVTQVVLGAIAPGAKLNTAVAKV